jgi:hypothetical protein
MIWVLDDLEFGVLAFAAQGCLDALPLMAQDEDDPVKVGVQGL